LFSFLLNALLWGGLLVILVGNLFTVFKLACAAVDIFDLVKGMFK